MGRVLKGIVLFDLKEEGGVIIEFSWGTLDKIGNEGRDAV